MKLTPPITTGEKLQIARRREELTHDQVAEQYKVPGWLYAQWERDQREGAPAVSVGRLSKHEMAYLLRRRHGMTQAALTKEMGRCRYSVNMMERGLADATTLFEYWGL